MSNSTQTLRRGLDILFVLAEAGTTLSVSEIAEKVNIPESTAYRLLQTLEKSGVVERREKGQIGLGMKILYLANSLAKQIDFRLNEIAKPIMKKLTEKTNETTVLTIRSGLEVICIESCASTRLIRFVVENGKILPLHQGASGKAILAFESSQILKEVMKNIENENKRKTLLEELKKIRNDGYCTTFSEVDKDIFGVGAPIFDNNGKVIASLTVAGPIDRWEEQSKTGVIKAVVESANEISKMLIDLI